MKIERITYKEDQLIDEVLVRDVGSVFAERMSNGHYMVFIYPREGEGRLVINLYSKKKIRGEHWPEYIESPKPVYKNEIKPA